MTQPFSEEQIAAIERIVARILEARAVDDEAKTLFLVDTHTRGLVEEMSGHVNQMSGRIDDMSGHVNQMSGRIDDMSGRIDDMSGRIDDVAQTQQADHAEVVDRLRQLADATANGFDFVNQRIDTVESRVDGIHEGFDALSNQNAQILRKLDDR